MLAVAAGSRKESESPFRGFHGRAVLHKRTQVRTHLKVKTFTTTKYKPKLNCI